MTREALYKSTGVSWVDIPELSQSREARAVAQNTISLAQYYCHWRSRHDLSPFLHTSLPIDVMFLWRRVAGMSVHVSAKTSPTKTSPRLKLTFSSHDLQHETTQVKVSKFALFSSQSHTSFMIKKN